MGLTSGSGPFGSRPAGRFNVYYVPEDDLRHDLLEASEKQTHCPHTGTASYRSIRMGDRLEADAVWAYREPIAPAAFLAGHAAFYWKQLDEWFVEASRCSNTRATRTTASTRAARHAR